MVQRDNHWIKLPLIFLVKDDLIFSKNPETLNFKIKKTEEDGFFVLEETLIGKFIRESIPPKASPPKIPYFLNLSFFNWVFIIIFIPVMIITYIINSFRVGFIGYEWTYLLLRQPIYIGLFFVNSVNPLIWILMKLIVQWKLFSLYHYLKDIKAFNKDNFDVPLKDYLDSPFYYYFTGEHILSLGLVTSIFVCDRDGLLSDELFVPQRILMIPTQEKLVQTEDIQTVNNKADEEVSVIESVRNSMMENKDIELQEMNINENKNEEVKIEEIQLDEQEEKRIEELERKIEEQEKRIQEQERLAEEQELKEKEKKSEVENSDVPKDVNQSINISSISQESNPNVSVSQELNETPKNEEPEIKEEKIDEYQEDEEPKKEIYRVLEINKNAQSPSLLSFEDPNWKEYISTLKPLGLNCIIIGKSHFQSGCVCLDSTELWKSNFISFY